MSQCVVQRAFARRRQSCSRHTEAILKVRNLFDSDHTTRTLATAALVAVLVAGVGTIPIASAETTLVAVAAPPSAAGSTSASATVEATPTVVTTATVTAVTKPTVTAHAPAKLTVRQTIAKVGHDAGLKRVEIDALLWIAKRESNYHPTSVSRGGCYGLFQLSRGMAAGHPWKDPAWNTKRAIKYMKGRYGSVPKAKAFWLRHHWY